MSEERPFSERGARSSHDGPVPGHTAIEVDREIQFRQLVWLGVGLVIVTTVAGLFVFFLLRGFLQAEREAAGPPPPMVAPPPVIAGPALLARPEAELERVRQLEEEQINSYGWVDASQGIVRIPIDRAIELVAAKGLPSRVGAGEEVAEGGTGADTDSQAPVSLERAPAAAEQDQAPPSEPGAAPDAAAVQPGGQR